MKSKEQEKSNKPVRERGRTLGVAKSTVWYSPTKKECTGELKNIITYEKLQKTTVVAEEFPVEEKLIHSSWPDQEHPLEGRHICLKVNNQQKTSQE